MKILCLTDFPVQKGTRWIWDYVPNNTDEVVFLNTTLHDRYAGWGKLLDYYPRLVQLGWKALHAIDKNHYDLVVAWEGKTGFPLAVMRQITGRHTPPLVILSFSIRGPVKTFHWLQRYGSHGADYYSVPTHSEQRIYAERLNLPVERIQYLPIGTHDFYGGQFGKEPGDYVFSGGRSGRDYATFLQAVGGLDIPVVLNARPFNLRGISVPANVHINDLLPPEQYRQLNWNARFVVVPLRAVDEAIGLTAILNAMAAGKAVICSNVPGPAEYVHEGETGLLVPVGDFDALRQAVKYLWEHPSVCQAMGRQGRIVYSNQYTFREFANRMVGYLHDILESKK